MIAATIIPPLFTAHVADRIAAAWEDSRPAIPRLPIPGPRGPVDHDGDSDPDVDELLRRARELRSNFGSCPECGAATGNGVHVCKPKVASGLREIAGVSV